ncbi:MAG TPA: hypothetical protein VF731_06520 [Solirubrobacterales bacterium]
MGGEEALEGGVVLPGGDEPHRADVGQRQHAGAHRRREDGLGVAEARHAVGPRRARQHPQPLALPQVGDLH